MREGTILFVNLKFKNLPKGICSAAAESVVCDCVSHSGCSQGCLRCAVFPEETYKDAAFQWSRIFVVSLNVNQLTHASRLPLPALHWLMYHLPQVLSPGPALTPLYSFVEQKQISDITGGQSMDKRLLQLNKMNRMIITPQPVGGCWISQPLPVCGWMLDELTTHSLWVDAGWANHSQSVGRSWG